MTQTQTQTQTDHPFPALTEWLASCVHSGGRLVTRRWEEIPGFVKLMIQGGQIAQFLQGDLPMGVFVESQDTDHAATDGVALICAVQDTNQANLVIAGLLRLVSDWDEYQAAQYAAAHPDPGYLEPDLGVDSDVRSESHVRTELVEVTPTPADFDPADFDPGDTSVGGGGVGGVGEARELSLSPGSTKSLIARRYKKEAVDRARATLLAQHRQEHDPATGASKCSCSEWEGPYTIAVEHSDNFGLHLVDVLNKEGL